MWHLLWLCLSLVGMPAMTHPLMQEQSSGYHQGIVTQKYRDVVKRFHATMGRILTMGQNTRGSLRAPSRLHLQETVTTEELETFLQLISDIDASIQEIEELENHHHFSKNPPPFGRITRSPEKPTYGDINNYNNRMKIVDASVRKNFKGKKRNLNTTINHALRPLRHEE